MAAGRCHAEQENLHALSEARELRAGRRTSDTKLPAWGCKGTTLFISLGLLAALAAALFLLVNKRMSKEAL